jgi:hypothetical protein
MLARWIVTRKRAAAGTLARHADASWRWHQAIMPRKA